ncbi:IS3 family transposase, partial [Leptonema illini]
LNRRRNNINGLIIHSDRGVQYASKDYRDVLKGKKISQSMSRKGNCWDNAVQESFFHTLKTECLYRIGFIPNFEDLRRILFDYIEVFYNRKRRHSALGYLSPTAYAQQIA